MACEGLSISSPPLNGDKKVQQSFYWGVGVQGEHSDIGGSKGSAK